MSAKDCRFLISLLLVVTVGNTSVCGQTQNDRSDSVNAPHYRHRYGLWFAPVSHSTIIDGISVSLVAVPLNNEKLVINGLNLEPDPVPVIALPILGVGGLISGGVWLFSKKHSNDSVHKRKQTWNAKPIDTVFRTTINGVGVATGTIAEQIKINGFVADIICGFENEVNGLNLSGLMGKHQTFRGVTIAGILNAAKKGDGVQIGLVNKCQDGKLVQIGLINKIGKRITPFINFRLKKKD